VKGDANAVEYVLECVEVMVHEPTAHFTVVCVRLHAHNDYVVKLGSDYIAVEHEGEDTPPNAPIVSAYKIVSEKEVRKQRPK